jgi:hypothetical protein
LAASDKRSGNEKEELLRKLGVLSGVAFACLVLASSGLAQSPSQRVYGGAGGNVQGRVAGSGGLPFTGLDLFVVIGAALLLLAAGLTMRRLGRVKS